MLDLKKLQYLEAVYRYKSFTRASEVLYVSQPAISNAIRALEEELGVKLMSRDSKKVVFTFEGEQFMRRVLRILEFCHETEETMKDLAGSVEQNLRLGISTVISNSIVPHIFTEFLADHPRAHIQLEEGSMNEHLELIHNESLDLAYNGLPKKDELGEFNVFPVATAQIYAVLNPQHSFSHLDSVPLELLAKEPLIMMSTKSKVFAMMMEAFEQRLFSPNIVFSYDQILCMVHVVETCRYIGIISVVNGQSAPGCEHLVLKPINEIEPFPVGFITKKDRYLPQMGAELIEFVRRIS